MTSVLLVADSEVIEGCLDILLSEVDSVFEWAGYARDCSNAIELVKEKAPDLVIFSLNIGVNAVYFTIKKIKDINRKIKIWVIAAREDRRLIEKALAYGVDAYLLSDICFENCLLILIKKYSNMQKEKVKTKKLSKEEHGGNSKKQEEIFRKNQLTRREEEVLSLVAEGMTNKEIAILLGISVGRVRNIVTELIMKCMVKNRTQLAVLAVKMGMV